MNTSTHPITIRTFYCNPFRVCTYIIHDKHHNAIIIDAGCQTNSERKRIVEYISQNHLNLQAHFLTHAHLDHLMGARFIYETYHLLPYLMPEDDFYFTRQAQQIAAFGCEVDDAPLEEYHPLTDGQTFTIGSIHIQVLATPGHTPGGCCFLVTYQEKSADNQVSKDSAVPFLFSGDTLFAGGVGRCDLPGGDFNTLIRSINHKILPLNNSILVFPGHGYDTTIGEEKATNPYL